MPKKVWDKILTKEFLEEEYLLKNKTLKDIAIEIGSNDMTVRRYVIKHGLPIRNVIEISQTRFLNKKFNKLKVIEYDSTDKTGVKWKCLCDCGKTTVCYGVDLVRGKHKSCCANGMWTGYEEIPGKYWTSIKRGAKNRNLEFKLTQKYVWNLFISQSRKCYYTGLDIYFNSYGHKDRTASLDRIDSSKGYIEGNVVWCHKDINKMKMAMKKDVFINYCIQIAKIHG